MSEDFAEDAPSSQAELCPEELDKGVAEELESLGDAVLDEYSHKVARDIVEMLSENCSELRFDLPF